MDRTSVLIARSQAGESEAREVLIESNLGLVRHIVRRFAGRGHDLEDLFQIGVIGLMKAIDKFNLELGLKFSTYAVPMITGEIKRFLRDDGPVKVSRTIKENGLKVRLARQRLQADMGREPTVEELAEAVRLLDVFYGCEGSLAMASQKLFIHRNTLQYRLRRIAEHTGYDPRSIRCAGLFQMVSVFYKELHIF